MLDVYIFAYVSVRDDWTEITDFSNGQCTYATSAGGKEPTPWNNIIYSDII